TLDTPGAALPPSSEETALRDWRRFSLSRLKFFAGCCLGDLSEVEFRGLMQSSVLPRIRENWDRADPGLKDLYRAIMERDAYERQQAELGNQAHPGDVSEAISPATMVETQQSLALGADAPQRTEQIAVRISSPGAESRFQMMPAPVQHHQG